MTSPRMTFDFISNFPQSEIQLVFCSIRNFLMKPDRYAMVCMNTRTPRRQEPRAAILPSDEIFGLHGRTILIGIS